MRLNESTIRKLEPPAVGNRIVYDDEIRGLGLRITAGNVRAFVLAYRFDGRPRRMTIGRFPDWSASAARLRAKELRKAIDKGQDPLQEKQDRMEAPTVEYIIQEYLTRYAARKKSGYIARRYLLRDVLPAWGKWKAADVEKRHVIELVERKSTTAPIAANMLLAIIKAMFNWAIDRDLLKDASNRDISNPASRVEPPAAKVSRDRWLTEEEIRTVWSKLGLARMAPQSRAALRLILITAQRPGEVLGAEWPEIDLGTSLWTIPREKAKAGIQHSVPLTAIALEEIREIQKAGSTGSKRMKREELKPLDSGRWMIPSPYIDGPLTVSGLANAVAVNQDHFAIPRWTPHDLRRTAATHMAKAGVDRFIIARILSHADKEITATYERHSYDDQKRAALERWEKRLRRILDDKPSEKVVSIS